MIFLLFVCIDCSERWGVTITRVEIFNIDPPGGTHEYKTYPHANIG